MLQTESETLPRGCTYVPVEGFRALLGKVLPHPSEMDPEKWNKKWKDRECAAKGILEAIIRHAVSRQIDQDPIFSSMTGLDLIDHKIGVNLTNRILLAQGLIDIQAGKLVVVTNNRIGISGKGKNPLFAGGESFRCGFECGNPLVGIRRFKGDFIGVVLNVESPAANPFKNGESNVAVANLVEVMNAVLHAKKRLYIVEREGDQDEYFTQEEIDCGVEWTLFGKNGPPAQV